MIIREEQMLDFNKLGDMAKIAGEARKMQERQERVQQEHSDMLKKISLQLDDVVSLLKERK